MSHDSTLPPDDDLTALESALRNLAPAPPPLDRDALMFAAGRAAAARRRPAFGSPLWPVSTAALALVAAVQATMLARHREAPPYVPQPLMVREDPPEPPSPRAPAPTLAYRLEPDPRTPHHRLARQLARYGLDALPPAPAVVVTTSTPPPDARSAADLLRAEVDRILNPGDPS